jgi:hypothetical protein
MKRDPIPSHILKLDGGNATLIAKRVGKSPATVRKWMRDGIPASARAACVTAVKRHNGAVKAAKTRAKPKARTAVKREPRRVSKRRAKVQREPTSVPMTTREKLEMGMQKELAQMFGRFIAAKKQLDIKRQEIRPIRKRFGNDPAGRDFLSLLVETDDDAWLYLIDQANELGLTLHDARQSFFSPKIR